MPLPYSKSPPEGWKGKNNSITKKEYQTPDILGYILAMIFLLAVFFVAQAFPFGLMHENTQKISRFWGQKLSFVVRSIDGNLLSGSSSGLRQTGSLIWSGAKQGVGLSVTGVETSGKLAQNFLAEAFLSAKTSILDNLERANKKITTVSALVVDTQAPKIMTIVSSTSSSPRFSWLYKSGGVSLVFTAYKKMIDPIRNFFNRGLSFILELGNSLSNDIYLAWQKFFKGWSIFGRDDTLSDLSEREQLKKEILQELQGKASGDKQAPAESAMFLLKPTGSTTLDLSNIKNIQDSFSDRVLVNFDQVGDTGVIQPIFRDRLGEKYFFVVTPIKK